MEQRSTLRNWMFALVTIAISTTVGLAAVEWVLRQQTAAIQGSSVLDDGLIQYDALLGWRLKSSWSGQHHHHDFDVQYSVDFDGHRVTPAAQEKEIGLPRRYWLGDSFTFGLGVNDQDTFLNHLNHEDTQQEHVNVSVPGYSTDQQLLQLQQDVRRRKGGDVVLVTYLGNDFFDNLLAFPLQADHGKPYFQLSDGRLLKRNVPVPGKTKDAKQARITLSTMVWGDQLPEVSLVDRILSLQMFKLAGFEEAVPETFERDFIQRHKSTVALYLAEVKAMKNIVKGRFSVVLLPGRSAVESPESLSGRVQIILARMVVEALQTADTDVLDLIKPLQQSTQRLYYLNEGHLNPQGHRKVADLLRKAGF